MANFKKEYLDDPSIVVEKLKILMSPKERKMSSKERNKVLINVLGSKLMIDELDSILDNISKRAPKDRTLNIVVDMILNNLNNTYDINLKQEVVEFLYDLVVDQTNIDVLNKEYEENRPKFLGFPKPGSDVVAKEAILRSACKNAVKNAVMYMPTETKEQENLIITDPYNVPGAPEVEDYTEDELEKIEERLEDRKIGLGNFSNILTNVSEKVDDLGFVEDLMENFKEEMFSAAEESADELKKLIDKIELKKLFFKTKIEDFEKYEHRYKADGKRVAIAQEIIEKSNEGLEMCHKIQMQLEKIQMQLKAPAEQQSKEEPYKKQEYK